MGWACMDKSGTLRLFRAGPSLTIEVGPWIDPAYVPPPPPPPRFTPAQEAVLDAAKKWTFPEEMEASGLEIEFGSRPF